MKLIQFGLLASLILVSACNSNANKEAADGYSFGHKQFEYNKVTVQITTYTDRKQLRAAAGKYVDDPSGIMAWSLVTPGNPDRCRVHMMDPLVSYEPEFVGHEFYHCVYGQFHTDNDSRK